jgi:hypothetical protein
VSYVLSVIQPPVAPAAFGQATVSEPVIGEQHAADAAGDVLIDMGVRTLEARSFSIALAHELTGTLRTHTGTAVSFRIDSASTPPNVCPCCGRLVAPEDAMFAGEDDTLCDGCYTWHRTTPQCLPANTAHTEEP